MEPFKTSKRQLRQNCLRHRFFNKTSQENEESCRLLIDLSPDAVIIHADGEIICANIKAAKLVGLKDEKSLMGKHILDFVHPDYYKMVKERIKDMKAKRQNAPLTEEKFIRADGCLINVEVTATFFYYNDKPAFLTVIRDITLRKQMEEALHKSEERYRKIVELSPDAIFVTHNDIIILANKAAARLAGMSDTKEMIGHEMSGIIKVHPDYIEIVKERIRKVLVEGITAPMYEQKLICLDRTVVDTEVTATPLPYKGDRAMLIIVRDITERKKTEQLQRDNEKNIRLLDEALEYNKLRTEFFANISHELRTPLNLILGTVQLLDLYLKSNLIVSEGQDIERHIRVMKQNCYRLLRLINNLIDITKIDSGYLKLNLQNCNIVEVIENTTLSIVQYAENNKLNLVFDTDIEEKIMACDPEKIERIMLNLLSNTVKFTNPGGSISVYVSDNNDSIIISVKDTGIGIPKNKLDAVFHRFVQVDNLFTRHHDGSGIGLSIVKSLVEMHGGKITVKSELSKGSEFILELPVKLISEQDESTVYKTRQIEQDHSDRVYVEFSDICVED